MIRERRVLWQAPTFRALGEAWLLGGTALLALTSSHVRIGSHMLGNAVFFLTPLSALWAASRLRVSEDAGFWRSIWYELRAAFLLSPVVTGTWLLVLWALGHMPILEETAFRSLGITLVILAASPFFLVFRAGVHLWLFWERLRRRRMVWSLTHVQVQLALAVAVLGALAMSVMLVVPGDRHLLELDTWVFTILPLLGVIGLATLVGIAVILPPALFFAWRTARRTTRRLEALAGATSALRQGEYATRILVEGEDEVAQLQGNFNAMASALERAMEDLQAERDKVAGLLETRRQLMASVSHELRTPLATIRGYLETLQQSPDSGDSHHDLQVMDRELTRLQTLIDDLFTLSRAEVEALALDLRPVSIADVIRRRVEVMAPLAWQRARVRVVAEVREDLPTAIADEIRLEQILVNLLRNALRYTRPGGIVAVSAEAEDERICVRVRDTGLGIPTEEHTRIWERFYRGDDARVRDTQGAGLGLALVKELAEAMGGSVAVESEIGVGSCFSIWLPRSRGI